MDKRAKVVVIIIIAAIGITLSPVFVFAEDDYTIPDWIKNMAGWWSEGSVGDADFVNGIKYLIENDIMEIEGEDTATRTSDGLLYCGDLGFTMNYPEDWVTVPIQLGPFVAVGFAPSDFEVEGGDNISVMAIEITEPISLKEFAEANLEQVKLSSTDNFKLIENRETIVSNTPAIKLVYSDSVGQVNVKYVQIFTIKDNYGYILTYTGLESTTADTLPIVEKMIDSFTIC